MNDMSDFGRLSAIVNSSDDAIISKDFDGIITSWNNAADKIFGFDSAEAIGSHITIIVPPEFVEEEKRYVEYIKIGSHVKSYETVRKRKDGSTFPASVTVSPIRNVEATLIGISIIARDITKLKLNERNNALLASIIASSDDGIISKNLNGVITSWNSGAEKIFGFSVDETIGKSISIIIPTFKMDEEADIISKITRGEKVDHIETVRKTKGGKEINVSVTVSPVKDSSGKIIGASKIARDITLKVEIEKERQLYIKKLQQLNDYKDDFMMMASHELRTPVTVIKASLQLLYDMVKERTADIRMVEKAISNVDKLSALVFELLDVTKIQNGKLDLDISPFNITVLLEEIVADIQLTARHHQIILKQPGKLLEIRADRERIKQVLINMLSNAVKYSPAAKEVIVETSVKENGVIVKVKDYGIGIPAEDIEKIFERFYRSGGVASTFSGVGVGLYISSEIIRHHGGRMWVESRQDQGSEFYIEIPHKFTA
ncbi:MAG: PAS domain S-box protein [Ginsengibacter sp.]